MFSRLRRKPQVWNREGMQVSRLEGKPGFPELAARTGIQLVLRFGSTVRGVRHPFSDADIAVQFDRATDDRYQLSSCHGKPPSTSERLL